jgi:excisionase family DNA binding protein
MPARHSETKAARRLSPIAGAAEYAACSPKTIRRMVARGDLTAYRLGPRLLRVSLDELDDAMRPIPTASIGGGDRAPAA